MERELADPIQPDYGQPAGRSDDRDGIDLLDFLFTVALSIGLTPELLQQPHLTGILSEFWVRCLFLPGASEKCGELQPGVDWYNVGVVFLGIMTITLSWWGYHQSIRSKPLRPDSMFGMLRFLIDILGVILYGLTLIFYKSFEHVATFLLAIFILYFIWDALKVLEYRDTYKENGLWPLRELFRGWRWSQLSRETISLIWAMLFAILWLMSRCWTGWGLLVAYWVAVAMFRVAKQHPLINKLRRT